MRNWEKSPLDKGEGIRYDGAVPVVGCRISSIQHLISYIQPLASSVKGRAMARSHSLRGPLRYRAVQDYLKQYIIENRLSPGDALPPETALAQDLGVSRGSVREAVKAMETLGIVEVRHGDGLFVRGFNLDAVLDLLSHALMCDRSRVPEFLQVRRWLELAALDVIVAQIDQPSIDRLEEIMASWQENAAQGRDAWRYDHREFHRSLNGIVGNDSLVALVDIFWLLYNSLRLQAQAPTGDVPPLTHWQNHRNLLDAILARDADLAKRMYVESLGPIERQMIDWDRPSSPGDGAGPGTEVHSHRT